MSSHNKLLRHSTNNRSRVKQEEDVDDITLEVVNSAARYTPPENSTMSTISRMISSVTGILPSTDKPTINFNILNMTDTEPAASASSSPNRNTKRPAPRVTNRSNRQQEKAKHRKTARAGNNNALVRRAGADVLIKNHAPLVISITETTGLNSGERARKTMDTILIDLIDHEGMVRSYRLSTSLAVDQVYTLRARDS